MLAAEVRQVGQLKVVERAVAPIERGHLLVEPLVVGVCATDQELVDGSLVYLRNGMTELPLIPGHEWVGRVVEKANDVKDFSIGDLVVGECSVGCGRCVTCWRGLYHQCPQRRETGIMGLDGALSQRMAFPARSAHQVPMSVSVLDAALVEPLAVALRATDKLELGERDSVLVVGAGVIGMLAVMLLTNHHAGDVYVLERNESRRRRALQFGAKSEEEGARVFDKVLEASGSETGVKSALNSLAPAGRLVLVGLTGVSAIPLSTDDLVVKDQVVVGSLGSPGVWARALEVLADRKVRPSQLITHTYPLERTAEAFQCAASRDGEVLKVVVLPNGNVND